MPAVHEQASDLFILLLHFLLRQRHLKVVFPPLNMVLKEMYVSGKLPPTPPQT